MQELNNLLLHHFGYAVRSAEDSKTSFEAIGAKFFHTSSDAERNLNFQFAYLPGDVMVELVSPYDPRLPCDVTNMIEKQPCTLYHVCFETKNLEIELKRLKCNGFKQFGKILTGDVYGYPSKGAFLLSKGTGLIELIQECWTDD